ncbi:MAG TPA: OmpA family protein [Muribaculaceae bacterium]|nr:OmpA family protein [Muribaculaceae bacterium]
MDGNGSQSTTYYDVNRAVFNLQAGVTYHFGPGFTCVKPFDQAEIDALNGQINELRGQLNDCNANAAAWEAKANGFANELAACKNRKPEVVQVKEETNILNSVRLVFFRIGSSAITADQQPNVEMVASYLKNHKDAKVDIKGYASPDGSEEINIRLANARAQAVKDALINKYKINANRISAQGEGIGNMFSEESWNRVSVCTIEDGSNK